MNSNISTIRVTILPPGTYLPHQIDASERKGLMFRDLDSDKLIEAITESLRAGEKQIYILDNISLKVLSASISTWTLHLGLVSIRVPEGIENTIDVTYTVTPNTMNIRQVMDMSMF